jgi:hypothetical protein
VLCNGGDCIERYQVLILFMSCAVFRVTKDVQESRECRRGVCGGSVSRGQASLQQQAQPRRPTLLFCLVYEGPGQKSLDYRAPY